MTDVINLHGVTGLMFDKAHAATWENFNTLVGIVARADVLAKACNIKALLNVPPLTADMKPGEIAVVKFDVALADIILTIVDELKGLVEGLKASQAAADTGGHALIQAVVCNEAMVNAAVNEAEAMSGSVH